MHNASRYAFIATEGPVMVFDFHNCGHLSEGNEFVDEVRPVCSWYYFDAGSRAEEKAKRWADEIADLVRQYGGGNTRLALDHCDPLGSDALRSHGITLHNGQEVLEEVVDGHKYAVVKLNGKPVSKPDFNRTPVPDHAEIILIPMIAGG